MSELSRIKHGFFNHKSSNLSNFSFKKNDFNLNQLNAEFITLTKIFHSNIIYLHNINEMVLYFQFIQALAIRYYQADYVAIKLEELLAIQRLVDTIFAEKKTMICEQTAKPYLKTKAQKIKTAFINFIRSFKSIAKLRFYISWLITNRSYWNYSRGLSRLFILLLEQSSFANLVKTINEFTGLNCSVDYFLKLLEAPRDVLLILGYSLYGLRLAINLILIAKHLILAVLSEELSLKKVLFHEMEKRAYLLMNDLIWGLGSLLSAHRQLFGLTQRVISQLNFIFLALDILFFLAIFSYELRQHEQRIFELSMQKRYCNSPLELAVLNRQIDVLNDEWNAQCSYYLFNIFASFMLVFAFGLSLVLPASFLLLLMSALAMLGNAFYNSANEYKEYEHARVIVERELINGKQSPDAYHSSILKGLKINLEQAENHFWRTLLFNTGFTALVISTAAISWPIALILTCSYLGLKLFKTFDNKPSMLEKKGEIGVYRFFNAHETISNIEMDCASSPKL
ncbi:MAG: hypothetical protein H0U70_04895 [Tatlockia sp.]|nr:hypothetical protein [Tatlockia sp.]